jgi:hypothetical protein
VLDHPVIQRCQIHYADVRNAKDHLSQRLRSSVGRRMTDAYHAGSALEAEAALLTLAKETRPHPSRGAASLREGPDAALDELYRVDGLGLPRTRRQRQALAGRADGAGWCAAGMAEAGKQFRRVNGHLHLPTLRAALERESAESVGTMGHDDQVSGA